MLRLTGGERAVAEIAATAEHITSLTSAAAAFQLQPDVPLEPPAAITPTVPLLDASSAPEAATTLDAIADWAATSLGMQRVPNVWRAFAHHPRLLEAVWRKNRLALGAGALDDMVKGFAALAVSQFRQSPYWIAYHVQYLRHSHGVDDRTIVEAVGMAMHALAFNTIAHGMRLEAPYEGLSAADVQPGGRLDQSRGAGSSERPAGSA